MLKFRNCSIKHRHWYSKERSLDFFLLQTVKFEGHRPFTKPIWKSRRFNFRRVVCRIVGRPLGTSFKFCMEGVGLAQAESIVGRGNVYVAKWRHNCTANLCTERFVRVEICRETFENAYMGKLYGNFACIVFRLAIENL